jgi:hypothetical protein
MRTWKFASEIYWPLVLLITLHEQRPEFLQTFFVVFFSLLWALWTLWLNLFQRPFKDQVANPGPHSQAYTVFSALQTSSTTTHGFLLEVKKLRSPCTTSQWTKYQARQSCGWQSQGWFKFLGLFSGHVKQETVAALYSSPWSLDRNILQSGL